MQVEDLAIALTFIFEHADELGVDTENYSMWGSSAGARMAAYIGTYGVAEFGGADLPKPSTVVMAYTGHADYSDDDPATFAVAENSDVDAVSSASVLAEDGESRGVIRVLAYDIQNVVEGDMFSIQTSVEYPGNINDLIDYAADEQEDNARPELTSHIDNLEDYDTIFVGYPNWWADLPMVMYSFFDEYDLSGKTIIPFCTHRGSRFSSTINTIQELEPDATVVTDGFTVSHEEAGNAASDIAEWLKGVDY